MMGDTPTRQVPATGRLSRWEVTAVALLLALSLGLRLTGLDIFIANDEIRWTCRSLEFREALRRRDWAGTFRVGHPGVVTTWLGAAFIPHNQAQAEASCRASEGGMELDRVGDTPEARTRRIAELGQLLFAGRIGVPLFTWLCIVVIYILARLSWGPRVAVLSLILIAVDPFYLALSRVLHIDAVLTSLMTISVLALLAALRHSGSRMWHSVLLVSSGVAGGLAILQKSPAVFLVPWTALLLVAHAWSKELNRLAIRQVLSGMVLWSFVVIVVYVVAWPAMWSDPVRTIVLVLEKAIGYAEEGHQAGNYFLGQPVQDPGWGYYPVAVAFRLSPVVLIGIIASLVWLLVQGRESVEHRFGVAPLLLYSGLFGALMTLGAKKFDRYLLPVFPALGIAAAVGLLSLVETVRTRLRVMPHHPLTLYSASCLLVLVVQVFLALPHYPHYLTYYNPLLGGLRRAKDALVVGWGEGYEQAAAYLNGKGNARELQAAVPTFIAFAPLFSGETRPISDYSVSQTDYVVFYLAQVQRQHDKALMERYYSNPQVRAEHTVVLHGVEYAWVYPNLHYVEPTRYVEEHSQPDRDVLMVNGDSVFGKHYQGELEIREFYSHSNAEEVAGLLNDLPAGSQRIWYPRYSDTDPDAAAQLLKNRGLLLGQQEYTGVKVLLYQLMEEESTLHSLDLRFGDLRLRGYGTTEPAPAWGRDGGVVLTWESDRSLRKDYTAFVHLYDSHGHRIAQGDSLIVDGDLRPTSQWEVGSSGRTLHHLSIPAGTPPGRYDVQVGVYDLETGERLPLLDAGGGDGLTYATLPVEIGLPDRPPALDDLRIAHPLERDITSQLRLLGYDLEHWAAVSGDRIPVRLAWKALGKIGQDYRLHLSLRGAGGITRAGREFGLVATGYETTRLPPGAVFQEWYDVPVGEHRTTGEVTSVLNLVDADGRSVLTQPLEVADVWVQSKEPSFVEPPGIDEQGSFDLGGGISLIRYDLEPKDGRPGDTLEVTLYWRANAEIDRCYKVFVHLYNEEGSLVGQRDQIPGLGIRPTTSWEPGEVVADRYHVEIGAGVASGVYAVAVGMYDAETGERVSAFGPNGERLSQDRILLGELNIRR
jgi:4-amino-4-deoxy-L-arabinose transferase-like glycosyltransferase